MRVLQLTVLFALYVVRDSSEAGRVRVRVPAWRARGQSALLACEHELAGPLYSLKWYRDNEEFYRYMPRQSPPHHSYRLDGIRVDLALSDARHVALRPLSLRSSGVFRCEVSAEAPSFASAHAEARMDVVFLPKEDPRITGQQERYQLADTLELNCTTSRSYPAATLLWFIGDMQVVDRSMLVPYSPMLHAHGLASSTLGLRVPATALPPAAAVRCRAALALPAGDGEADGFSASDSITPIIDTREVVLTVRSSGCHAKPSFGAILLLLATSLANIT